MAARKGGGFWRGFLVGSILAILALAGLAWVFPTLRPPEVDESALVPPAGPAAPGALGRPGAPAPEDGLPGSTAPAATPAPEPDRAP